MRRSKIIGTGSYIPTKRIKNDFFRKSTFFVNYGNPILPNDSPRIVDKFMEITGISERRWVNDDLVASDIGYLASEQALQSANIDRESLDYIVFAHNFGDISSNSRRSDFVPCLAARVKQRLGIVNSECIAYDLAFGCAGWVQSLIQADYYLRSGDASSALLIGAETLSRVSDPHDRDSMIYSDGAGAAIIQAQEVKDTVGIISHSTRSDAFDNEKLLWMGPSYDRNYPVNQLFLKMNGRKILEYARTNVPLVVKKSLDRAGIALGDVTKIFLHQGNAKMAEAILKGICELYEVPDIGADIMPMAVSWLGNNSVATVPTVLDLVLKGNITGHRLNPGDTVVLAAVGAGMNICSLVYRWD